MVVDEGVDNGYFQVDRQIVNSSVWVGTDSDTKVLWLFLLLAADIKTGIVRHTIPALARDTGISKEVVVSTLETFSAPDPYSRSQEYDGRKIEFIEPNNMNGGICVLNYRKYREKNAALSTPRVRKYRNKNETNETFQPFQNVSETKEKEKEKEKENKNDHNRSSESSDVRRVLEYWAKKTWSGKGRKPAFDAKRRRCVAARLKDGYSVDELCRVVDGYVASPWHNGTDPKSNGKTYLDATLMFRDVTHVEKMLVETPKTKPVDEPVFL